MPEQELFVTVRKRRNKKSELWIQNPEASYIISFATINGIAVFLYGQYSSIIDLAGEKGLSTGIYSYKLYRLFR